MCGSRAHYSFSLWYSGWSPGLVYAGQCLPLRYTPPQPDPLDLLLFVGLFCLETVPLSSSDWP